jgi:Sigma-70, region 4
MNINDLVKSFRELFPDEKQKKKKTKQHGPIDRSRLAEMERLRFVENWSNTEIGKKFGISRERVRQLIGNTGYGYIPRKQAKLILSRPDLTNTQLAEELSVSVGTIIKYRGHQRHAIEKGKLEIGIRYEIIVSDRLKQEGIDHKLMPHHHPFDILLGNGKRIDVKSATHKVSPKSQNYSFYTIRINKKERGHYADFFIIYIVPENMFLVIPFDDTPEDYLRFFYPKKRRKSKFLVFKDRFDLLKI